MSRYRISVRDNLPAVMRGRIKVWLDGEEVSNDCVEADPVDGYVILDEKPLREIRPGELAKVIKYGNVRIEQEVEMR